MPCVRGHALYMKAIPGGKAKNARIDVHKSAVLLRGGMVPPASGSPAERRATRDLLRRRMQLMRHRAGLLAHLHKPNSQDNLPQLGKQLAYNANREGVAERFPEPAVQQSIAVDLTLIGSSDRLLTALELDSGTMAKAPEAQTCSRLRSIPGVGNILALVRLYEIHAIHRFPRVQEFVSSCRLVKCAKASASTPYGTAGAKIGTASHKGAFSEAAVRCLRNKPAGPQYLARLANKQGKGTALTVLAHQRARAVYDMCTRDTAFDLDTCRHA
jgi:transposase